jgi:hypothetical protein
LGTSPEKINKKKKPVLLEANLRDLLSFKQKQNVDNNLKKERMKKMRLRQKLEKGGGAGEDEEDFEDYDTEYVIVESNRDD